MNKQVKKISALTAAAALASSVLVPVASADEAQQLQLSEVVFVKEDGSAVSLPMNDYRLAVAGGALDASKVTHFKDSEGNVYAKKDYQLALAGKEGSISEALTALNDANKKVEIENLQPGKVQDGEVVSKDDQSNENNEVKSVKAINQTIASETSEEIKFEVNSKEYTLAEFNKAFEGYTVEFFTNNSDISIDKDGKVNAEANFKYAVQVTDEAGNKVPAEKPLAKDFADVKVEDAKVATKIHAIGLAKVTKDEAGEEVVTPWENPTVTAEDTKAKDLQIVATEFENALGDKNTDVEEDGKTPTEKAKAIEAPKVKTAVSSDPTVAYYEDGVIVRNKDGKVTFTVTFEGDQFKGQEFKLEVTAKAEQKATSIEAKDLKVKADEGQTFDIKVLDQDGEEMRKGTDLFYTSTATGKPEAAKATELKADSGVKFAAGNHVVNIYADAEKKTKLGSFKVEAVDVSPEAEIEEYKFVVADDSKDEEGNVKPLDLNTEVKNKELKLDVKAFIEDIEVGLKDGVELEADSSDDEVAKVKYEKGTATVTAEKVGKATITLYTVEGQMKTPVATYEVEVTDSTKPVETLTLKDNTKVIVTGEENEDLKAAVQVAVKEENIEDKIAEVVTVEANGIVIVTMEEEYGGKEFTLDAIYGVAELEDATYAKSTEGTPAGEDTPAVPAEAATLTFTFSEAVKLEGDFKVTVKDKDGKETTLPVTKATLGVTEEGKENNKEVVVELSEDVVGTQTITKLEGVQAVKGIVIVPEGDSAVKIEVNEETEG